MNTTNNNTANNKAEKQQALTQPASAQSKQTNKKNVIGILGGTFDPIHHGHLTPALKAATYLKLDQVLLMPAHISPHKTNTVASAKQRATMVELACLEQPLFKLDRRELKRNSPSYTVATLKEIKKESPDSCLYFFIGMDSLLNFTRWFNYQEILKYCHLIVNSRPGYDISAINMPTKELLKKHQVTESKQLEQQNCGGIFFIKQSKVAISSTEIRAKLRQNLACDKLLPKAVLDYIQAQALYLPIHG
jgi:nicotinate-nucleotide adenylyltransferase